MTRKIGMVFTLLLLGCASSSHRYDDGSDILVLSDVATEQGVCVVKGKLEEFSYRKGVGGFDEVVGKMKKRAASIGADTIHASPANYYSNLDGTHMVADAYDCRRKERKTFPEKSLRPYQRESK